jgi:hypothetical protein
VFSLERKCHGAGIIPFDEKEVAAYQEGKLHSSIIERFVTSFKKTTSALKKFFLHGKIGERFAIAAVICVCAGWTTILALMPDGPGAGLPGLAISAIFGVIFCSGILAILLSSRVLDVVLPSEKKLCERENLSERDAKEMSQLLFSKGMDSVVRWMVAFPVALPFMLLSFLPIYIHTLVTEHPSSDYEWRTMPLEEFMSGKELTFDIISAIDRVIEVFPGERVEAVALTKRGEQVSQEAFLVIDIKGMEQKKLYLEHILH